MIKGYCFILVFFSPLFDVCSVENKVGSREKDGIELSWEHNSQTIRFQLSAKTSGWVAVGFTEGTDILATNLIQASVVDGTLKIEDQYVTGFGKHPTVEGLGGSSLVKLAEGFEKSGITSVSFELPINQADEFHYALRKGKEVNVWLAFSVSDDFMHHSRKRFLRTITL